MLFWVIGITNAFNLIDSMDGLVLGTSGLSLAFLTLVAIGNGRRTGGFFMTPHTDLADGKLTLAYGYRGTRLGMFQALPRAFNEDKGSYIELEGMYELNSTKVSIHLDQPSPAYTDGELLPEFIRDFNYSIQTGRLQLLVP